MIVLNNLSLGHDENRNRSGNQIDVSKVSKSAAVEKGLDYLVDLSIFYAGFIALSIFWLHERTRDHLKLIQHIESVEKDNGELDEYLNEVRNEFQMHLHKVEENQEMLGALRERVKDLQENIRIIDKYL